MVEQSSLEDAYKELIHFVEKYPTVFPIMHSTLFMQILRSLTTAKDLIRLKAIFPFVEAEDLEQILVLLINVGLVAKFKASNKEFYHASDLGRRFLELYDKAKLALLRGGLEEIKLKPKTEKKNPDAL